MIKPLTLALLLSFAATPMLAQAPASSRAKDIAEAFSTRRAMPPLRARALLNAAPADVCAELGKLMAEMPAANARRLMENIASSTNPTALASLVLLLENEDSALADDALDAILVQELPKIVLIRKAIDDLDSAIIKRMLEEDLWPTIVARLVVRLCPPTTPGRVSARSNKLIQKQLASALFMDAFAGEVGFKTLINGVLDAIVGKDGDWELLKEAAAEKARRSKLQAEASRKGKVLSAEELETEESKKKTESWNKAALNNSRRQTAMAMFTTVMLYSPEYFQLMNGTYAERRERADGFWDEIGERIWDEHSDKVHSWSDHLMWASRYAESDFRSPALLIMDKVCGGVKIPTPSRETAAFKAQHIRALKESFPEGKIPKEALNFDDFPKEVQVFTGDNDIEKIKKFNLLHSTHSRKPRIRGLRSAFEKVQKTMSTASE